MSDHEEQQSIVDFSDCETREQAIKEHMDARDYVCHAQAYTPDELRTLADDLDDFDFATLGKKESEDSHD